MGWSTSRAECILVEPDFAARYYFTELLKRKRRSTAHSTTWMGWSTSPAGSAESKPAARFRRLVWQGTIGDVIPSNSKKEIIHTSPTQTSPPLTCSRRSRKRARRLDIMSTISKRAVALESTGGAVTFRDINVQQSAVKRDSSVKTEMQLSL